MEINNAFAESFNGRLQDECLNETLFTSVAHGRAELACWRRDYNTVSPIPSSIGSHPPRSPTNVSGGMPPDTLPSTQTTTMKGRDSTSDW